MFGGGGSNMYDVNSGQQIEDFACGIGHVNKGHHSIDF